MTTDDEPKSKWAEPGISHYAVLSIGALIVIFLVLGQRGFGSWALFPVTVGLIGVATCWSSAPVMVLLTVAGCLHVQHRSFLGLARPRNLWMTDLILCGAALGYVMAHYRLQSLTATIFPVDPRRRLTQKRRGRKVARQPAEIVRHKRSPALVTTREIGWFVLSLPVWAVLAQFFWLSMPSQQGNPGLPPALWRGVVLAWLIGLGLYLAASFLGYWRRRAMTLEQATLFLQDEWWQETRGEERRINRWLAWARLRRQRRKEKP